MAKFINIVTGNVLCATDPLTVALMSKSDRYKAVDEAEVVPEPKKASKAKAAAET